MPRIRTIKPEFFDSPSTARASLRARLFFIALWCWADDYGVGTANARQLIGFAFPNDPDVTDAELPSLRAEVADAFGVVWYEVDGRPYYAIPSWEKHQRNERRAQGKHPGPDKAVRPNAELPTTRTELPHTSGLGTGEQGNRGTGEQSSSSPLRDDVAGILDHLDERIRHNGAKVPTRGKTNIDAARLMLDNDERDLDEVHRLIDWATADDFWRANVLSAATLRRQYDKLRLASQRPKNGKAHPEPTPRSYPNARDIATDKPAADMDPWLSAELAKTQA